MSFSADWWKVHFYVCGATEFIICWRKTSVEKKSQQILDSFMFENSLLYFYKEYVSF